MSYFDTFESLVLYNTTGFFKNYPHWGIGNRLGFKGHACRTATLNVEQVNILSLVTAMKDLREQFPEF